MPNIKGLLRYILPPFFFCAFRSARGAYRRLLGEKIFYDKLRALIGSEPQIEGLFPAKELESHYAYEPMRQTMRNPDLMITQARYFRMYEFFKKHYPDVFREDVPVVDVGDTSGILFRAMRRKGLSVNINPETVEHIRAKGIDARLGDAQKLPFGDKSFDYAFCFQCLEHLSDPIGALRELNRVARKKVFLSIPYSVNTAIYSLGYWKTLKQADIKEGGWGEASTKDVDCHIFEFSAEDLGKILSHSGLKLLENFPINYFSPLGSTHANKGSYFNFFILEPS